MKTPATFIIKKLYFPEWGVTLRIIIDELGAHCVIYEICGVLGITGVKEQRAKLQRREAVVPYMRKFDLPTSRGDKETWCLHEDALGFWMALIDPYRVRPEFERGLVAFQALILKRIAPLLSSSKGDDSKIIYLAEHLGKSRDISLQEDDDSEEEGNGKQEDDKGHEE